MIFENLVAVSFAELKISVRLPSAVFYKLTRCLDSNDHEFCNKGEIFLSKSGQQRIVMELFPSDCPIACENFIRICAGNEKDPFLTYKNCKVHRIVPGFVLQSGDIQFGNGSGGQSVFDKKKFKDERRGLDKEHNQRGILVSFCFEHLNFALTCLNRAWGTRERIPIRVSFL